MLFDYFRDKEGIDVGDGTGTKVTNVFGDFAQHTNDFDFSHANFSNFKGTYLSWKSWQVIISGEHLNINQLTAYNNEQCFEFVFQHLPTNVLMMVLDRNYREAYKQGVEDTQAKLREIIGL